MGSKSINQAKKSVKKPEVKRRTSIVKSEQIAKQETARLVKKPAAVLPKQKEKLPNPEIKAVQETLRAITRSSEQIKPGSSKQIEKLRTAGNKPAQTVKQEGSSSVPDSKTALPKKKVTHQGSEVKQEKKIKLEDSGSTEKTKTTPPKINVAGRDSLLIPEKKTKLPDNGQNDNSQTAPQKLRITRPSPEVIPEKKTSWQGNVLEDKAKITQPKVPVTGPSSEKMENQETNWQGNVLEDKAKTPQARVNVTRSVSAKIPEKKSKAPDNRQGDKTKTVPPKLNIKTKVEANKLLTQKSLEGTVSLKQQINSPKTNDTVTKKTPLNSPGLQFKKKTAKPHHKGPLEGIRILDLTRLYPGPLATMMMADLGADVIKVEDMIHPDAMRNYPPYVGEESAGFLAINRSKRSIALKFNEERSQKIFFQLVETADIVIEQYRPGVLKNIGMDYEEAVKSNSGIIYISLTGYGQSGPYAKKAGHDINFLAYSGILGITGSPKAGLVIPGVQIADVAGGAYMSIIAALSALRSRDNTGKGQHIDVSMLDSVFPLMSLQLSNYWASRQVRPAGELPLSGGYSTYGIYKCKDGKNLALGALEPKFWKRFCEIIEKPQWVERIYDWDDDSKKLHTDLSKLFKKHTRDEWIEMAGNADCCLTPVLDISEIENDPQLKARGMIVEQHHPACGKIKSIGMPIKFSNIPPNKPTLPPSLGQNTLEILDELGYSQAQIKELKRFKSVYFGNK